MTPAPTILTTPSGTKAISVFAISLLDAKSEVSINWTEDSAIFGQTFVGPNPSHVLADNIFKLPLINITSVPSELSVSFNFFGGMTGQPQVQEPVEATVGPEGNASQVQITAYTAQDKERQFPTTVTVLFQQSV